MRLASWLRGLSWACFAGVALGLVELALLIQFPVVDVPWRDVPLLLLRLVTVDVTLCVGVSAVVALVVHGLGLRTPEGGLREERLAVAVWFVVTPAASIVLWLLSSGRRLADLPMRPWLVGVAGLGVGVFVALAVRAWCRWLMAARVSTRTWMALGCVTVAAVLFGVDLLWLPRLYPALHGALATVAVVLWLGAFAALPPLSGDGTWAVPTSLLACGAAPFVLWGLAAGGDGHAGFVIEGSGVVTGKLVRVLRSAEVARPAPAPVPKPARVTPRPKVATGNLDLSGHDVLLITVDALRADRLAAYGGHGLTPAMDRLAQEGLVFLRAYTPTPSTSYALTSLLSATCVRTAFEASAEPHFVFAAERLARAGYRTAAFYPPAMFHVDGPKFDAMRAGGFGFDTRVEDFATAAARVTEVRTYLGTVPAASRVFVWTHILEPHEPYETHGRVPDSASAEARYDVEVMETDRAIGELVTLFRAARPRSTIIVTADHGEEFGDHGGYYHGTSVYDEQVRVPLLWWSDGGVVGQARAPVNLTDVMTTLLPALGVPPAAEMRGRNLADVFAAPAKVTGATFSTAGELMSVVDGHHKWIGENGRPGGLLFDLDKDPAERRDMSRDAPDKAAALGALFGELRGVMVRSAGDGAAAAFARARVGDASVAPEVMAALGSDDAVVRRDAARAAGELALPEFTQVLARLRGDNDGAVRHEATLAGALVGDGGALQVLRSFTKKDLAECDGDFLLRRAFVLSEAGVPGGETVLRAAAVDDVRDDAVRRRAVLALGHLRDRRAVPLLIKLLPDDDLRVAAATALSAIGDRRARPALQQALAKETYDAGRDALTQAIASLEVRPSSRTLPAAAAP